VGSYGVSVSKGRYRKYTNRREFALVVSDALQQVRGQVRINEEEPEVVISAIRPHGCETIAFKEVEAALDPRP
jgi:hypothetical protein